jgi:hypothetical protein
MNQTILYTMAQIAMTLAGFSGFVAAFRLRGKNAWSSTELRMLWFLILDSFMVVFLSLLPVVLSLAAISHAVIWSVCSLLLGAWFMAGIIFVLQGEERERASAKIIRVTIISRVLYGVTVIAFLVALCLWLSAFHLLIPGGQATYVGGLIILMALAALEFLFFIGRASATTTKT